MLTSHSGDINLAANALVAQYGSSGGAQAAGSKSGVEGGSGAARAAVEEEEEWARRELLSLREKAKWLCEHVFQGLDKWVRRTHRGGGGGACV